MDGMLPTLHEADGEHDTSMHGEHALNPRTHAAKRARIAADNEHRLSSGAPLEDDNPAFMEPPESFSEDAELDVQVPCAATCHQ